MLPYQQLNNKAVLSALEEREHRDNSICSQLACSAASS